MLIAGTPWGGQARGLGAALPATLTDDDKRTLIRQLLTIYPKPGFGWETAVDLLGLALDLTILANPGVAGAAYLAYQYGYAGTKPDPAADCAFPGPWTADPDLPDGGYADAYTARGWACRRAAADHLAARGVREAVLPLAASLLKDPDSRVQVASAAALRALLDMTVPAGERRVALDALETASREGSTWVRAAAGAALAQRRSLYPPPDPVIPLQQLVDQTTTALTDPSPMVREAGLISIQTQGLRALLPSVLPLLADPAPRVRARAAAVLGALLRRGDVLLQSARAALTVATRDPDPTVAAAARAALAKTRWLVYSTSQLAVAGLGAAAVVAGVGWGAWRWRQQA